MEEIEEIIERIEVLLQNHDLENLQSFLSDLNISDIEVLINEFPDKAKLFIELLPINRAIPVFRILDFPTQERIIKKLSGKKIAEIINELPPDDRTSFLAELHGDAVKKLVILLPPDERKKTLELLGYPEDSVGRLMTPHYITIKLNYTISEALAHIRKHGENSETIDVLYVVDNHGKLLDDIRIKDILTHDLDTPIQELIDHRLIALQTDMPQEEAIGIFRMNNRVALPVVDNQGIMLGIVTVDDILWVANEEYAEDMQRIGGTEALSEPYLDTKLLSLVKKRAGWLVILFVGELLTASVMQHYEDQLAKAIVLSTFIPLIISSGGNSGSQASTLIIQAMAVGEVAISDWWTVMKREFLSGTLLGIILGIVGFIRIFVWNSISNIYGDNWVLVGLTVSLSLIGIVLWGSLVGSMLPFVLRKVGADPASSSAPFVATLVDVTGLIIYFSAATMILGGHLL